jgi:hypothetical protein
METKLSLQIFKIVAMGCGNGNIMICQPKMAMHSHEPSKSFVLAAIFSFIPSIVTLSHYLGTLELGYLTLY